MGRGWVRGRHFTLSRRIIGGDYCMGKFSLFIWEAKWKFKLLFIPQKKIYGIGHPYYYYRCGNRIARIGVETQIGAPGGDIAVYERSLDGWAPPHDDEMIPIEIKEKIWRCLFEEFERRGTTYELV